MRLWDKNNCQKVIAEFYKERLAEYDIPEPITERAHVWRATLNTMYLDRVPEVARTEFFGHTAAVSREHYTDLGQVGPMLLEAQRRRTEVRINLRLSLSNHVHYDQPMVVCRAP